MLLNLLFILIGLAVLIVAADALVKGAASLAVGFKVAPLIVGLTIVSFGTSAPELTVNVLSAVNGSSDLALGNILGSNIANILLVLGVVAAIKAIKVKSSTVWKEIPFALLGALMLFVMGNHILIDGLGNDIIHRTDGIMLLSLMAIFMFYVFSSVKNGNARTADKMADETDDIHVYPKYQSIGMILAGLIGLFIGGRVLVDNAVSLALAAGMSEAFIGLTIVAIGTSLPELVTSVVAAMRGHVDLAIGNVVGSNIFNTFWVVGLTSVILPLPVSSELQFDIMVNIFATLLLFVFMFMGKKHQLSRFEGSTFIVLYASYLVYLVGRG